MRLKSHFQIFQNCTQITNFLIILICHKNFNIEKFPKIVCTRAIKLYTNSSKYAQKWHINCKGKVNYVVDHAANFKQQIVDCCLECFNTEKETC